MRKLPTRESRAQLRSASTVSNTAFPPHGSYTFVNIPQLSLHSKQNLSVYYIPLRIDIINSSSNYLVDISPFLSTSHSPNGAIYYGKLYFKRAHNKSAQVLSPVGASLTLLSLLCTYSCHSHRHLLLLPTVCTSKIASKFFTRCRATARAHNIPNAYR